jgi:hypothetical protein
MLLVILASSSLFGEDKMPKDVKLLVKLCGKEPGCSSLVRNIQVHECKKGVGSDPCLKEWRIETLLIIRSVSVHELKLARFRGEDESLYIILQVPEMSVDAGLVRIFEGK